MLDFDEIKAQYPKHLQRFDRAILREYLQYKILQSIFESRQASQLSFLGGTALRIVYGNNRFSEDIDLDNFGLSWAAFDNTIDKVKRFLELEGYKVEIRNVKSGAFHCYLRFPDQLYQKGISPHREEKILIQVDTIAQGYVYQPDITILNKFDVFTEIRVTPLNVLLSQKIYTSINRKRPKGRDFYDITFLFGRTKPDFGFINHTMGINSSGKLREEILESIEGYDFNLLAQDVAPFLVSQDDVKRVTKFKDFWKKVDMV